MSYTMERWYSATGQRFSMRKYGGAPEEADMEALAQTAKMLSGDDVRLVMGEDARVFKPIFLGGGKVKGTPCFAALIYTGDDLLRCGYIGESFILECTALGLGTCWLGGSYKKGVATAHIKVNKDERMAAVIAFGKPGESYVGRPRKTLAALTGLSQEALIELPEWQQLALSCARLAPSAVNGQPWEFRVEGESISVVRTGANFGFGRLDQGIAMLHVELGAAHGGMSGSWAVKEDAATFSPLS
ncbi:MAG: nitroreductase family protein [Clostridia bacterium]|nr:nitroreductase family protein [Clostridia bacterium]